MLLTSLSSCGDAPAASASDQASTPAVATESPAPQRYDGSVLYGRYCLSCHGEKGIGDGVSAKMLTIQPRDFTAGIFKFRSVSEGLPSDADLARTIRQGIGGTEMSAYDTLPPEAIDALVAHVKTLTVGEIELWDEDDAKDMPGVREVYEDEGTWYARVNWFEVRGVGEPLEISPAPKPTQALVDRGKELYEGVAACVTCHGPLGHGDGSAGQDLKDEWGFPIKARNFTSDQFKGGDSLEDIYRRVMLGIPGTPMPSSKDLLPEPTDPWALVYYIQKLRGKIYIPK